MACGYGDHSCRSPLYQRIAELSRTRSPVEGDYRPRHTTPSGIERREAESAFENDVAGMEDDNCRDVDSRDLVIPAMEFNDVVQAACSQPLDDKGAAL